MICYAGKFLKKKRLFINKKQPFLLKRDFIYRSNVTTPRFSNLIPFANLALRIHV
jgi:hypothetical protein